MSAVAAPTAHAETIGGAELATTGLIAPAQAPTIPEGISAEGWLIGDLDSGSVLAARNPHGRFLPASTLKTLTALTLLPRLADRQQLVTATQEVCNVDGTRVGLVAHGQYSVEMLFQCMLMMSGNDCATLLAEAAGGLPQALDLMNAEARRLHALDTHAATPSGLDGPGQSSSAYDLALILREALTVPDFGRYNTNTKAVVPAQPPNHGEFEFSNDNLLLANYPGVLAAKNGFTDDARHTFVAAVQKGQRRLVVTLMHGERRPVDMWQQARSLLEWGFGLPPQTPAVGELVQPDPRAPASAATTAQSEKDASNATTSSSNADDLDWTVPAIGALLSFTILGTVIVLWRRRTNDIE